MANLTVRQLDEDTKRNLRLRAARNGRSMEDETRNILRDILVEDRATTRLAAVAPASAPQPDAVGPGAAPRKPRRIAGSARDPRRGLAGATILLVIGGGIAAYKSLDLIRRLRERGATVRAVMTKAAQEFVTPLSVGALTGGTVFTELFARESEHDVGHIRLAREADLVILAPATADRLAKMAAGMADDLAGAILLATSAPILLAPAMNPAMWSHPATTRNVATLAADGAHFVGPNAGEMAESGEAGLGRMAEPLEILAAADELLAPRKLPLAGRHIIVTSGPTHEPLDPVRYLANRSSGKQGHAIAAAAAEAGARVILVSGPVSVPDPPGVEIVRVETAAEMLEAVERALPADVAIMAAAVADWRAAIPATDKIKKGAAGPPHLALAENPDILATIAHRKTARPGLVIGFAAETNDLLANATAKRSRKGADWILANDVADGKGMGQDDNTVHLVTESGIETWPTLPKDEVAARLVDRIAEALPPAKDGAE